MTRTERRLIALAQKRESLKRRIALAGKSHKATDSLHHQHVQATAQQIKAELAIERKQKAA